MRMTKWLGALALTATMLSGAALSGGALSTAHAQETKLRIGHVQSITTPTGQASTLLGTTVKDQTKGAVTVDIFPGAQLGGELEMLSQVRLGSLDMAMLGSGIVAAIEPSFSLTELPYIWKDGPTGWKVLNGPVGEKMLASLEAKGIKGLAFGIWGDRGILLNGPKIEKPEDLKGLKIRVIENPLYVRTVRAYGANAVPMAWPEVYTGLQQKTIDGVETNYHGMDDSKLYEVGKELAVVNHIYTATVYVMNLKKFNAMTPEAQKAIVAGAKAAGALLNQKSADANADAIAKMEKSGVHISRPDLAPFRAATKPVRDYFTTIVGPELMEEVEAAQK